MSAGDNHERNQRSCASCKFQRKKCQRDCLMAPHFPADRMAELEAVHKIFGIDNTIEKIKDLSFEEQQGVVKSMVWEASLWVQDPVHGPLGQLKKIEEEINFLKHNIYMQTISATALLPVPGWCNVDGNLRIAPSVNNCSSQFQEDHGRIASSYNAIIAQEQSDMMISQGRGFQETAYDQAVQEIQDPESRGFGIGNEHLMNNGQNNNNVLDQFHQVNGQTEEDSAGLVNGQTEEGSAGQVSGQTEEDSAGQVSGQTQD